MSSSASSRNRQRQLAAIQAIIFDVDNTLVFAKDARFYQQYGEKVEQAIAAYFGVSPDKAKEIADYYRSTYGGGEQALFLGDITMRFPGVTVRKPNFTVLYDQMVQIKPRGQFKPQLHLRLKLEALKKTGIRLAAMTSSPDRLSKAILESSGFNVSTDFDIFKAYQRQAGPSKMLDAKQAFMSLAQELAVPPKNILAVGDTYNYDVRPAQEANMIGCPLCDQPPADFTGLTASSIDQIVAEVGDAISNYN